MEYIMCARCKTKYTEEEYDQLERVKVRDDDPDPCKNYGYTAVCRVCGKKFHEDTRVAWDEVETKDDIFRVSTVCLETPFHCWWPDCNCQGAYYETIIFGTKKELDGYPEYRWHNEREAIEGHNKIVKALKEGKYTIKPKTYELDIDVNFPKRRIMWAVYRTKEEYEKGEPTEMSVDLKELVDKYGMEAYRYVSLWEEEML